MRPTLHGVVALTTVAVLAMSGCARREAQQSEAAPTAAPVSATPAAEAPVDVDAARLETSVRLALLEKLGVRSLGIDIDVSDGQVTLSGDVPSAADKEVALEAARATEGVASVTDELGVEAVSGESEGPLEAVSQEVQDEILASRVKLALYGDMDAAAFDIDVDASKGEVTLHGTVPDEDSHGLALATARSTEGVTKVVDDLTVKPADVPGPYTEDKVEQ